MFAPIRRLLFGYSLIESTFGTQLGRRQSDSQVAALAHNRHRPGPDSDSIQTHIERDRQLRKFPKLRIPQCASDHQPFVDWTKRLGHAQKASAADKSVLARLYDVALELRVNIFSVCADL